MRCSNSAKSLFELPLISATKPASRLVDFISFFDILFRRHATGSCVQPLFGGVLGTVLNVYPRAMLETSPQGRGFCAARVVACEGPAALASDSQTQTSMNAEANEVESWESER